MDPSRDFEGFSRPKIREGNCRITYILRGFLLVPAEGIEPPAFGFQNMHTHRQLPDDGLWRLGAFKQKVAHHLAETHLQAGR
jgi:hypothetical protein